MRFMRLYRWSDGANFQMRFNMKSARINWYSVETGWAVRDGIYDVWQQVTRDKIDGVQRLQQGRFCISTRWWYVDYREVRCICWELSSIKQIILGVLQNLNISGYTLIELGVGVNVNTLQSCYQWFWCVKFEPEAGLINKITISGISGPIRKNKDIIGKS